MRVQPGGGPRFGGGRGPGRAAAGLTGTESAALAGGPAGSDEARAAAAASPAVISNRRPREEVRCREIT
ncbi:hypothetical protein NKH18_28140 [Streptomyces sp. M10(2022)]